MLKYTYMAKKTKKGEKTFKQELITQLLTLSTSGFGLVAALAWNDAIQVFVKDDIQRFFPNQSGLISKLSYALLVTILAVLITYQLSRLASRWGVKK